jgi:hypothetical protein
MRPVTRAPRTLGLLVGGDEELVGLAGAAHERGRGLERDGEFLGEELFLNAAAAGADDSDG